MQELFKRVRQFNKERDWGQFHTPSNLAKSIAIEAAELLEHYQWSEEARSIDGVKDEIADVLIYCIQLCIALNLNPSEIINEKLDKNEKKYPVDLARGNSKKYSEF